MNTSDFLNVSRQGFGAAAVNTGNLIYEAVKSLNSDAVIEFQGTEKLVVIKNLGESTIQDIGRVLYNKKRASKYYGWYPIVKEQRSPEGHYLIQFSPFPSGSEPSTSSIPKYVSKGSLMFSSKGSELIDDPVPQISVLSKPISDERILEVKTRLSKAVISAMTEMMSNSQQEFTGVWYPTDLKEYLSQKAENMPEEYWTGYASPEYFIKTGRYTFHLKEGKSASDAVNALIAGPSVLDCGNATQLAYYKGLLDVIGPEKFDVLFSLDISRLVITQRGITDPLSPIYLFSDYTSAARKRYNGREGRRPLKVGEECHFKGVTHYANKHPAGFASGWNVIYMGDNQDGEQLFIAHGFKSPMTENQIYTLLAESYNQEMTPEDIKLISEQSAPSLFDRNVNKYLYLYYTIPMEIKDQFMEGFLLKSCRGLKAKLVAKVLEEKIDRKFLAQLHTIQSFEDTLLAAGFQFAETSSE